MIKDMKYEDLRVTDLNEKATEEALAKAKKENLDVAEISGGNGLLLVRVGSNEYKKREEDARIITKVDSSDDFVICAS